MQPDWGVVAAFLTIGLAALAFVWREYKDTAKRRRDAVQDAEARAKADGDDRAELAKERGAIQEMLEEFGRKFDRAFDGIKEQGEKLHAHLLECAEARGIEAAAQKTLADEVAALRRRFDRYDAANLLQARGLANRAIELPPDKRGDDEAA